MALYPYGQPSDVRNDLIQTQRERIALSDKLDASQERQIKILEQIAAHYEAQLMETLYVG